MTLLNGLFVTGTDTGIGKTVASAALFHRYRSPNLRYWKPIQTGVELDDDTREVVRLASADTTWDEGIRLPRPLSPHLSARLAGTTIDLLPLLEQIGMQPPSTRWIVEGAGGVLVPVNERDTMATLMVKLGLPVLVVSSTRLGTINHTLLTIEALRARQLTVAGVLMVGEPNVENARAIATYGRVPIVGELPTLDPLTPATLARAAASLDPESTLATELGTGEVRSGKSEVGSQK